MKIQILNKVPRIIGQSTIIRGNSTYTVSVYPDSEWDGKVITAIIVDDANETYDPVIVDENGTFTLPTVTSTSVTKLYIGFISGNLRTTAACTVFVSASIRDLVPGSEEVVPDPTPDVYDVIIEKLNAAMVIATEAEGYRNEALEYKTAAGTSASEAAVSASTASTKADEAAASAQTASSKASEVSGSASAASSSAQAAAVSEENAGISEDNAAASAEAAAKSASEAASAAKEIEDKINVPTNMVTDMVELLTQVRDALSNGDTDEAISLLDTFILDYGGTLA